MDLLNDAYDGACIFYENGGHHVGHMACTEEGNPRGDLLEPYGDI